MSPALAAARAQRIPGWMSPEELHWLAEQASKRKLIVEVGSYMGRSTKALALSTAGVVYSVDNLVGEDVPTESLIAEPHSKEVLDFAFRENLAAEIKAGKIKVIRKPSLTAAKEFRRKADMIFIDADHGYENVLKEVRAWRKRLALGGLLCGHDAADDRVQAALVELGIAARGPDRIWLCE